MSERRERYETAMAELDEGQREFIRNAVNLARSAEDVLKAMHDTESPSSCGTCDLATMRAGVGIPQYKAQFAYAMTMLRLKGEGSAGVTETANAVQRALQWMERKGLWERPMMRGSPDTDGERLYEWPFEQVHRRVMLVRDNYLRAIAAKKAS